MPSTGHSCLLSYSVRLCRSQSSRVVMQSNRYQNLCGLTNCDCFVTLARPTVVLTGSPGLLSNKGSSTFQSTAVLWHLLLRLQGLPQSGKGGVDNCPWAVKWCTPPLITVCGPAMGSDTQPSICPATRVWERTQSYDHQFVTVAIITI